jgi:hypothetical protein
MLVRLVFVAEGGSSGGFAILHEHTGGFELAKNGKL